MAHSWLFNAAHQATKPKNSIIERLKTNLGGTQSGRSRDEVHASDVTSPTFCARKWIIEDRLDIGKVDQFIPTALATTFQLGTVVERLVVEDWARGYVIGDWKCVLCEDTRTMTKYPDGTCKGSSRLHMWRYHQRQLRMTDNELTGAVDALFDVGASKYVIVEVKILAAEEFDKIQTPIPEHRLRTNLYMHIVEHSSFVWKDSINTQEARVLYVSRGYGRMHPQWNEILPFKEYVVTRQDADVVPLLKKAKLVHVSRQTQQIPSGICGTPLDPIAKKCSRCKDCFGGAFPPTLHLSEMTV